MFLRGAIYIYFVCNVMDNFNSKWEIYHNPLIQYATESVSNYADLHIAGILRLILITG
jgi:hypothetical protein